MDNRTSRSPAGSLATIGIDDNYALPRHFLDGYPARRRTAIPPSKKSHLALPNPHPEKSRTASMDSSRSPPTILEGRKLEDNSQGGPSRLAPGPTAQ